MDIIERLRNTDRINANVIKAYLDEFAVGQQAAKKTLSTALSLHFIKQAYSTYTSKDIKKSNVLLAGPSGNGKTYLVDKATEALNIITGSDTFKVLKIDASKLSIDGWHGTSLSEHLANFFTQDCQSNIETFNQSIVFLDEFDKLANPRISSGGTNFNREIQYSILKAIEGEDLWPPELKNKLGPRSKLLDKLSTKNMLFIFAGNFPNLRQYREIASKKSIGFVNVNKPIDLNLQEELQKVGVVTQIIGRISMYAELTTLTRRELKNILVKAKDNVYEQYRSLFEFCDEKFELSDYHLNKIVDGCLKDKTGARGLQRALEAFAIDRLNNLTLNLTEEE